MIRLLPVGSRLGDGSGEGMEEDEDMWLHQNGRDTQGELAELVTLLAFCAADP